VCGQLRWSANSCVESRSVKCSHGRRLCFQWRLWVETFHVGIQLDRVHDTWPPRTPAPSPENHHRGLLFDHFNITKILTWTFRPPPLFRVKQHVDISLNGYSVTYGLTVTLNCTVNGKLWTLTLTLTKRQMSSTVISGGQISGVGGKCPATQLDRVLYWTCGQRLASRGGALLRQWKQRPGEDRVPNCRVQ